MKTKLFRFNGGTYSFSESVSFYSYEELNVDFFRVFFQNKIIETNKQMLNVVENLYKDFLENNYLLKNHKEELNLYVSFLEELNTGFDKKIFLPEQILGIDLDSLDTIQLYRDEFNFRTIYQNYVFKYFQYNNEIMTDEYLDDIVNSNKQKILNLAKQDLEYLYQFFNTKNYLFNPFETHFPSEIFNEYYPIIETLKIKEDFKIIANSDAKKIKIYKEKSVFQNELSTHLDSIVLEDVSNGNKCIYIPNNKGYNIIVLKTEISEQSYYIYNYGNFVCLIEYFDNLFNGKLLFPKYQVFSKNIK